MQQKPELEETPAVIVELVHNRGRPPSMLGLLVWYADLLLIIAFQLAIPKPLTVGGDKLLLSWMDQQAQ